MFRPLIINPEVKNSISRLVDYASKPDNYYDIRHSGFVPGDRPEYVLKIGDYRCVFTISRDGDNLYRHLSISIPKNLPTPTAAFTIANLFGFTAAQTASDDQDIATGPGENWTCGIRDGAVVIIQKLED